MIVTHSLDVVKKLCDRAIWIYKGEFKLDGDPTYVIDEYLKQVEKDHHNERRKAIESGKEKSERNRVCRPAKRLLERFQKMSKLCFARDGNCQIATMRS